MKNIRKLNYLASNIFIILIIVFLSNCDKEKDTGVEFHNPLANPQDGPAAGNPGGNYPVPAEAAPEDVSNPDHVIGDGTPGSCTAEAFVDAVHEGGTIVFNTGGEPVTITLTEPAKVYNREGLKTIIDGGGLVTLSGGGKSRI